MRKVSPLKTKRCRPWVLGGLRCVGVGLFLCIGTGWGDERAKLEDGREVILKDDGTWEFAEDSPDGEAEKAEEVRNFERSEEAKPVHEGSKKNYTLYLKPNTWVTMEKPGSLPADALYGDADQEMSAMVIAERVSLTTERLKKIGIKNAQMADPNAKVVSEKPCKINGKDGILVRLDATVDELNLAYLNVYYGGPEGSIQIVTWTTTDLFEDNRAKLEDFIRGVVIHPRTGKPTDAKVSE